jgi:CheY-like chemotaxis protein
MAGRIVEQEMQTTGAEVHEWPRVLVVDDETAIHEFFASRLGKFGIDTLYAPDAVHGFRIACKENPSVIITGNFIPNGDARYLLHRLRSTSATENIPVFVISGKPIDEVTEQTLRREIGGWSGAAQIFTKSFDTEALFSALKKFSAFETHHTKILNGHTAGG